MSIVTTCPGCGRTLQVEVEHAGKQARCPACNEIYTIPASSPQVPTNDDDGCWHMRTPEGQTYGPVDKAELNSWVQEGRVTADCLLSSERQPAWVQADAVYPDLRPVRTSPRLATQQPAPRYIQPHRGVLVLILGILSWATLLCPIFGICAWVMGSADLREMRAGRMDSSGMSLTHAGQVIGMVHAMILIVVIVLAVFLFLLRLGIQ